MGTEDLRQLMDYRYIAENDKFSTNFVSTHHQNFFVLSESDIKRLQDNDINHILSVLSISRSTACLLLTNYKWNTTQVLESWFDNLQKVQKTIGLSNQPHLELGFPNSSQTLTMCNICFETFASDKIKSSWCGHPFCFNCWNQYVDTNIDDHNCFKLKCPQPSCNAAVDEDMIHQLASKSAQIKYDQFLLRSYVENNSNVKLKWCPAPNCCYAVSYYEQDHGSSSRNNFNYDVTCRCYHSFCWNCGEEAHAPVNCETVAKWMKRISPEFKIATNGWIIANTKRCPNCKIPVEKGQGCNHMACKCAFHFCWLCLRDWSLCPSTCGNSFNGVQFQIFEDEMQNNHAKVDSDRYTYYYQGWANNEVPRKQALQNLIQISPRLATLHNESETYFDYIKDALKQIVECRKILKWSFVYGYYLPHDENAKIEFFDLIENMAQYVLDSLLRCAQYEVTKVLKNRSEEEFPNSRMNLITMTGVSKSYFMNLVNELENGLDVVAVKNYTGVKRKSSENDEISFKRWNTRRRSTICNMTMRGM